MEMPVLNQLYLYAYSCPYAAVPLPHPQPLVPQNYCWCWQTSGSCVYEQTSLKLKECIPCGTHFLL